LVIQSSRASPSGVRRMGLILRGLLGAPGIGASDDGINEYDADT
jgi:hypothetical protein